MSIYLVTCLWKTKKKLIRHFTREQFKCYKENVIFYIDSNGIF